MNFRKYPILTLWLLSALPFAAHGDDSISGVLRNLWPIGPSEPAKPVITIGGLSDAQQDNVRAFLTLTKEACTAPRWRVEHLFTAAEADIGKALRALGHYHPRVEKHLAFAESCWQADFTIDAGPDVKLTDIKIEISGEAKADPAFTRLLEKSPIKPGRTLNHGSYEALKKNLHSLAQERGYFDAKFTRHAIHVDTEHNSAKIELNFAAGRRYRFGAIKIEQKLLDPDFVKRFIPFHPGEPYSSRLLADTYNDLSLGGYFSNIELKPRIEAAHDLQVPIDMSLHAQKRHRYEIGLGYDTNYGPLFSVGYLNRRLNSLGHTFNAELDVSPVLSSVETRYNVPLDKPTIDFFSVAAGFKHEEPKTFTSDQFKLSLQRQHVAAGGWKQNAFLDYVYEAYRSAERNNSSVLLVPGLRLQYTQSNSTLRATEGHQLNFSFAGAHNAVVSDVSFLQGDSQAKWIVGTPWPGRLIGRGEIGATLVSDFDALPVSYRYYAGGAQSIRGYQYKELGPKNAAGQVVGGKLLTVASLEYEHFIGEKWGLAAFADAGNAYNRFSAPHIKVGAGVGVRWLSPVGPLRIDFALPLNESSSSFQVHFAAGAQL